MQITLKAARVNCGLSQQEAARHVGVSPDTLRNWEAGRSYPNAINILKIEMAYGITYDQLSFLPKNNAQSVKSGEAQD